MNIEKNEFNPNYIKLDFQNKTKLTTNADIEEEESDLKAIIESFEHIIKFKQTYYFFFDVFIWAIY